ARIEGERDGLVGNEIFANELELRSSPAASASAAVEELTRLRRTVVVAGGELLGAGLHPGARTDDAKLIDTERATRVRAEMRGLITRTPECALHVHVGMPDAQTAVRVHNGLRSWMPLLCALAASSPYWFGQDSGLASARRALTRPYPGRGIPDPWPSFEAYRKRLGELATAGAPADYTLLWWDIRLHPALGTVEVREMDAQPKLEDVAAIGALIRGLACHEAEASSDPLPREAVEWSMFRAMRDGPQAEILNAGRLTGVREAAESALAFAAPHAKQVGDEEALSGVKRIVEVGSAARQRRAFAGGQIPAVVDLLRAESAATTA
nr:YbdK family carboxylate-amine ligase [Actinomycetota bacterium]